MPDVATIKEVVRARLVELEQQIEALRLEAKQLTDMLGVLAERSVIAQATHDSDRAGKTRAVRRPRSRETRGAAGAKRGRPTGGG